MSKFYALNHKKETIEVDPFEWSDTFFKDPEGRQVDKTVVGQYVVSTVFDGMGDIWGNNPTVMFETTVYRSGIKQYDLTVEYYTWDDAAEGHKDVVAKLNEET